MAEGAMGQLEEASLLIAQVKGKPMTPRQCNGYMKKKLAESFEEITAGFVDAAKSGSCQHVKLATELLKTEKKAVSRKKGPVTKFYEQWEKDRPERERLRRLRDGLEDGLRVG